MRQFLESNELVRICDRDPEGCKNGDGKANSDIRLSDTCGAAGKFCSGLQQDQAYIRDRTAGLEKRAIK